MSTRSKVVFDKDGNRREVETTAGELLPEHLRKLPGDYVTKNTSDPDRVHELDAPHVVANIVEERLKTETEESKETPEDVIGGRFNGAFNQENIDLLKFKVMREMIKSYMLHLQAGEHYRHWCVHHLWFDKPGLDSRQLRIGNPPSDTDRPKHLKGLDLVVDPYRWPPRVVDILAERGIKLPNIRLLEAGVRRTLVAFD